MMSVEFPTTVNMLPWRDSAARAQRMRLLRHLAVGVVVALLVVGMAMFQLQRMRASAELELNSVRAQIASNQRRATAAQLTVNEIARWKGFALLEPSARDSHLRVLHLLRDLSAQAVTGIALSSIEINGEVIEVKGSTKSKSLAVDFVRGLKARGWPAASPTVAASDAKLKEFQFLIKPKAKKKK